MFKSAVIKLTAWYVGALVFICLLFSLPLYSIASNRLRRGAEMQTDIVRRLPDQVRPVQFLSQLEGQREKQLQQDRRQLIMSFLITNGVVIVLGGFTGYLFARRTLQPIQEAHEAQAKFTANASHELRTPLAVMQTEIEVALRNEKLSSTDAKDILASNLEEVERLRQLSDQLLGLTRVDEQLKLRDTNVSKLITDEVVKLSKRYSRNIAVDVSKGRRARIDPVLFRQVIGILVDNAVTYGGEEPGVAVVLGGGKAELLLTVSDTGPGISLADQSKIFDRFYRGGKATTIKPNGHGLGLALAKDIITRHGGTIAVTSSAKKGTVFAVIIPA